MHLCGCSSAGRARPRHGRGHEFEARHPLHSGCAHALRCRATWCWRPGCARSWPGHVQRDTTSDGTLARGHSRSGFTALVAQQAEQPSCKRQAARSNRRRGHQTCRVRLAGRGHRAFNPGTRVRIPHATPPSKPFACLVNSAARVPACLVGSRGFDSRTRRQITAEIAQTVERRVEGACVGGSKPSLGTRTSLVSSAGFRAPVYETGGRTFDSCTRQQPRRAS